MRNYSQTQDLIFEIRQQIEATFKLIEAYRASCLKNRPVSAPKLITSLNDK